MQHEAQATLEPDEIGLDLYSILVVCDALRPLAPEKQKHLISVLEEFQALQKPQASTLRCYFKLLPFQQMGQGSHAA
jgi:hypothetical protein